MINGSFLIASVRNGKVQCLDFAEDEEQCITIKALAKARGLSAEVVRMPYVITQTETQHVSTDETYQKLKSPIELHVKCIETGQVFANATQCAKQMQLTIGYVNYQLHKENCHRENGYNFTLTTDPLTVIPLETPYYTRRTSWPGAFKVICIETGIIYDCVRDAAHDNNITMQRVYNSIHSGKAYSGLSFEKVKK